MSNTQDIHNLDSSTVITLFVHPRTLIDNHQILSCDFFFLFFLRIWLPSAANHIETSSMNSANFQSVPCWFRPIAESCPTTTPTGTSPKPMWTDWRKWQRRLRPRGRTNWRTPSWFMAPNTPGGMPPAASDGSSGPNCRWSESSMFVTVWLLCCCSFFSPAAQIVVSTLHK